MSNELTDVRCPCGAEFPAESYDAGFIAGSGMCQNCDAALPPKDICTCPSGDGSLVHPCPAHPAPVEQAGGDERDLQGAQGERDGWGPLPIVQVPWNVFDRAVMWVEDRRRYGDDGTIVDDWKALKTIQRAALAQPSPAQARSTWPKLEKPAQVGAVRFSAGVSSRLVVEAAQRLYEFESTPEKEAERIERLQAFREQLDPLNLAPHAKAFNEAPAEALKPEQAEAERPEVVGSLYLGGWADQEELEDNDVELDMKVVERLQVDLASKGDGVHMPLMTVAQHERLIEARWNRAMDLMGEHVARISEKFKAERDAALAKLAELEKQEPVAHLRASDLERLNQPGIAGSAGSLWNGPREGFVPLYAAPVAQAQHSVPEGWRIERSAERIVVMNLNNGAGYAAARNGESGIAESVLYLLAADLLAAAPGKEVPQAWLDVQAERRRQVEVEGYHGFRDNHYISYELSKAARAYIEVSWHALSGGLPCKKPESWPWMAGFKWSDGRTMLVKACALALAEIERLDRAAHGKEVGHE
ncbi:hypothetical protein [Pseudomonas aeruginosa]|uniref:hypothetical protein n=1 Tax=Pseudomonas aeruginosa TaxID=287 RepID=UPI001CA4B724|nr:hypothetical protein [Pseudomonas aeruginosa]MBW6161980.1 hypothetical protein [Pseudomonas aeruginosa]